MVSGTTPVVRRGPWLGAAGPDRFPCSSDEELVVFSVSSRTHEMEMDGSSVAAPSSGFCVLGASVLRGFAVMNRSIVVASDVVSTSRRGCTVEVTASFLLELFLCRRNIIFRLVQMSFTACTGLFAGQSQVQTKTFISTLSLLIQHI